MLHPAGGAGRVPPLRGRAPLPQRCRGGQQGDLPGQGQPRPDGRLHGHGREVCVRLRDPPSPLGRRRLLLHHEEPLRRRGAKPLLQPLRPGALPVHLPQADPALQVPRAAGDPAPGQPVLRASPGAVARDPAAVGACHARRGREPGRAALVEALALVHRRSQGRRRPAAGQQRGGRRTGMHPAPDQRLRDPALGSADDLLDPRVAEAHPEGAIPRHHQAAERAVGIADPGTANDPAGERGPGGKPPDCRPGRPRHRDRRAGRGDPRRLGGVHLRELLRGMENRRGRHPLCLWALDGRLAGDDHRRVRRQDLRIRAPRVRRARW
mmetsp:Transcript_14911/g.56568  ORF Transcript_14911/g.56568 Transcript_14911/m.56568 type:complete len:323 (-) Transcript_14911:2028-2996(-)